jgi:hypothetical protein
MAASLIVICRRSLSARIDHPAMHLHYPEQVIVFLSVGQFLALRDSDRKPLQLDQVLLDLAGARRCGCLQRSARCSEGAGSS